MEIAQASILHLFVKVLVKIFISFFNISCYISVDNFLSNSWMTYNDENKRAKRSAVNKNQTLVRANE